MRYARGTYTMLQYAKVRVLKSLIYCYGLWLRTTLETLVVLIVEDLEVFRAVPLGIKLLRLEVPRKSHLHQVVVRQLAI